MRYSEPLLTQVRTFLSFGGVGFLLGALYLAFGFLRALFGDGRRATAVCDLLFCFCAFGALFAACLGYTDGMWRLPELLAATGGFLLFLRGVGPLLQKPLLCAASALRRFCAGAFRPVGALADRLAQRSADRVARLRTAVSARRERRKAARADKARPRGKKWRKNEKNRKKALAKPRRIQYNDS
jgi:hypothetical protein